ncbi:MAG: L,D-transpeptidase family protein [Thiohalomonadaceae bacterium]
MRRMLRWLAMLALTGLLSGAPAAAGVRWPADVRTLGEVSDLLRHMVAVAPTTGVSGETVHSMAELQRFYRMRDYAPAWIENTGVTLQTADVLERLRRAWIEGLDHARYHPDAIEDLAGGAEDVVQLAQLDLLLSDAFLSYARDVREGRVSPREVDPAWHIASEPFDYSQALEHALASRSAAAVLDAMAPDHEGYRRLRVALARYHAVERRGGWPLLPAGRRLLRLGVRDARVPILRTRFVMAGVLRDQSVADERLFDAELDKVVRHFQQRHGLTPDGVVGEGTRAALNVPVRECIRGIVLNMERWRWLPRRLPARYAMVNMAGFELVLYDSGLPIREMRVIIGRDQRQTPALATRITSVVFNPYWYVPETVLREDLLPALAAEPELLGRLRLKVFSDLRGRGKEVDVSKIDWSRYASQPFPYTLRQEPGPDNALGRYKFILADTPAIYLHDTSNHRLFQRRSLALSSGCIRVEDPEDLAAFLLGEQWQAQGLARIAEGQPHPMELATPVPIYLLYFTAWVNELNELHFREDIYGRDSQLHALLGAGNASMARAIP